MPNRYIVLPVAGFIAFSVLDAGAAETVPNFDLGPTCRGATRPEASVQRSTNEAARKDCLSKEGQARDTLRQNWASFPAEHRDSCARSTSAGGIPSYIQLQTCLETRRGVAKSGGKRDEGLSGTPAVTTGQGN